MEPKVIYEDKVLLVVDKPAGMVVNRSETTRGRLTLEDWLVKQAIGMGVERNGIVHRLDKETSGVLVVAKSQEVMRDLQKQFKERKVQKTYLGLVHGRVRPEKGKITMPITRSPFNRQRFGVFVGGKSAETKYQVEEEYEYEGEKLSLVKCWPKTGRTHQIRVHLKHIGHPLVADQLYAGRKTSRKDRSWCPRLWLQAVSLELSHPVSKKKKRFEVELAVDLKTVLRGLKKA
jgi:23S rRNA pseudouridine1911/1915/1917 synthase